jgi:hypothetical protein
MYLTPAGVIMVFRCELAVGDNLTDDAWGRFYELV